MKEYAVYILTNFNNTVFYTGITNNLARRVWEHKNNKNIDSLTGKYKVYKLVWFELFITPEEAIMVEKKIKGWVRIKKVKLIRNKNPEYKDLSLR